MIAHSILIIVAISEPLKKVINNEKKIYLVDDDDDDRMLIGQAVHELLSNVKIVEYSNGPEFLENILGQKTLGQALVLMDMNMPRMNGLEVITAMMEDPSCKQLPVLVISTADDPGVIEKVIARGASGYFTKPATFEQTRQLASDIKKFYCRHYSF